MKSIPITISGYEAKDGADESHCLNANDNRKVFGAHQAKTMVAIPVHGGGTSS